jgi:hypothetical protein
MSAIIFPAQVPMINLALSLLFLSSTDTLASGSELAKKFGPFFFSVFFLTTILIWAENRYRKLTSRNPGPTYQEKLLYGTVFLGSFVVGVVLVFISVSWWKHYEQSSHVYRGVFKGLHGYESLDSDAGQGIFFHDELLRPNGPLGPDTDLIHNAHFVVIRNSSFTDCEKFAVDLSKGSGGARESLDVEYRLGDELSVQEPTFAIEWDAKQLKNVLKRTYPLKDPCAIATAVSLSTTVYADSQRASQMKQSRAPFTTSASAPNLNSALLADVNTLQDTRSSVGSKLQAMRDFAGQPREAKDSAVSLSTSVEPVLVTFLDLTRHSDKELEYWAISVLQGFDSDRFVLGLFESDGAKQSEGIACILHMEEPQAERVLARLKSAKSSAFKLVSAKTHNPDNFLRLRPTGSPQGDRYYVQAKWNPENRNASECLTSLFNKELISNRSIQQEAVVMKGRSERLVFWYTKDWAIQIAGQTRACGGNAAYVSPFITSH